MVFATGRMYQVNNPRARLFGRYVKTVNVADVPERSPMILAVVPVGKHVEPNQEPTPMLSVELRPATLEELVNEFIRSNKADVPISISYDEVAAGKARLYLMPTERQLATFSPDSITDKIEQWGIAVDDITHDVTDDYTHVIFHISIP
jgi:hypothetical protein